MSKFDWPLNDSHFTMWDRMRIAKFFLNPKNRWTQGDLVKEYERKWRDFVGSKYAVMTSSGSTANTLMAMRVKDSLGRKFRTKNRVILPAVTWQTSVAPWIREGFRPVFFDIQEDNLCIKTGAVRRYLKEHSDRVACVFPTSLLGMKPGIVNLNRLNVEYPDVKIMMDNCENTFGYYETLGEDGFSERQNISNLFTSSTSMYFGHQATTGGEGGMIFTNDEEEYEYFLMARNHGMVRGLSGYSNTEKYRNENVDERFDFYMLGNNYRSTDVSAFIGLLDFEKMQEHIQKREALTELIITNLSKTFFKPWYDSVLFAFPIIPQFDSEDKNIGARLSIENYCKDAGIEYRPIISGNLLNHTAYKNYRQGPFPVADYVHKYGLYVGIYPDLDESKLHDLILFLNFL